MPTDPSATARGRRPGRRELAQATPLVAIALLLAALLLVPLAWLARATIERSAAQNAADAAALAGALAGEDEARAIAAANGARLTGYERRGNWIEVEVVVGDRRATARAERVVGRSPRPERPEAVDTIPP